MPSLTASDLHRVGIGLEPEEFERLVLEVVRQLPAVLASDPRHELTGEDAAALSRGGFELEPLAPGADDPLTRTAAEYTALAVTGLSVSQVAQLLGIDDSRVRQRLAKRTLYGIKLRESWRLPAFQFDDQRNGLPIRGIEQVVPALDPALHPVAVYRWFMLPHPDLVVDDAAVSPRDWLRGGGNPAEVAALAAAL